MKKTLLFLGILGVSFLFGQSSLAWQTFNVSNATVKVTDNTHYFPQEVEFPESGCLDTVTLLYDSAQVVSSIIVATNTVNPNPQGIWHGVVTTTAGTGLMYATFFRSSTYPDYPICYTYGSSNRFITSNNINFYTSNNSSSYVSDFGWDQLGYSLSSYTFGSPAQNADVWIDINGFSTGGSSISWYSTPTSTCDFKVWPTISDISLSDVGLYGSLAAPMVRWGLTPNAMFNFDTISSAPNIGQTSNGTEFISEHGGIVKNTPLMPGYIFYAEPLIAKDISAVRENDSVDESNILVLGDRWEFIIAGVPNENGCQAIQAVYPDFSWPFTTTTPVNPYAQNMCDGIDVSGFTGQVKLAMCQALQTMFSPSEASVNAFLSLKTDLENKPPFGYFGAYSSAIAGFESATTTTSTVISAQSDFDDTLTAFSTFWLNDFLKDYIFSPILYLLFGFYVYYRFKHFDFNR